MDVKISSAALKLVSLNVTGVSNFKKRRTIFTFNCPLNPTLDKRGGIIIPRKSVVDSIECLQSQLNWLIFGELKILKQEVTLGVKNHLLYYVLKIFGLFSITFATM